MKRGGLFQSKSAKCYPQFAGHCQWAKGEIVQPFSTMEMPSGTVHSREITFPDMISWDSRIDREDLAQVRLQSVE